MKPCRLKISLVISYVILSTMTYGQVNISGRVIDKQDGIGLPGVSIIELGIKNGTVTDTGGYFSLKVNSSASIIQTHYVGYKSQEIKIGDSRYFCIELKVECNIDFFDCNDICVGISSGILNSPIGGFGYVHFPFFGITTLRGELDYQTDLSQNQKLDIKFGTLHLIADCDYDGDIILNYRSIDKNDFTFNSYSVEGKLNFSRPKIFPNYTTLSLGYGLSDISKSSADYKNNSGFLLGCGTLIGRPLYLNVNLKTIYWMDFWEFIGEIKWQYKNLIFSTNYNVIDSYYEINLKFGYIFNY